MVAKTLDLDGALCDGTYDQSKKKSLADSYDYVMHGMVYNIREDEQDGAPPSRLRTSTTE